MNQESNEYSAVLADLKSRRIALDFRISNRDSAIGGIRSLLEEETLPPAFAADPIKPAKPSSPEQAPAKQVDRRRKSAAAGVCANPFPGSVRPAAQAPAAIRKRNQIRCTKCNSTDTRQSLTRGMSDFLLFFFDYTNARCRSCGARFRVWRPQRGQGTEEEFTDSGGFVS